MLNLVLGRALADRTDHLLNKALEITESGEKVIFMVPEQFSLSCERLVAEKYHSHDQSRIEVLGFKRLAEKVCKICGELPRRHADDGGRLILMIKAYEAVSHSLKFYGECGSPAFFNKLLKTYKEFTSGNISPQLLCEFAEKIESRLTAEKLGDLGLIFESYDALCDEGDYENGRELGVLAELLRERKPLTEYHIIIDSFDEFTALEYEVLDALMGSCRSVTVSLCCDSLTDKNMNYGVLSGVIRTAESLKEMAKKNNIIVKKETLQENQRFLDPSLEKLEQVFVDGGSAKGINVPLYCAADEYDECEQVASTICRMVRTQGYDYSDFAVVARQMNGYLGVIDTVFDKYQIPYYLDIKSPLKDKPIVLFAHCVLRIAAGGFKTVDILSALKTGLTCIDYDGISALESYVKYWGIDFGMWRSAYEWKYSIGGLEGDGVGELETVITVKNAFIKPLEAFTEAVADATAQEINDRLINLFTDLGVMDCLEDNLEADEDEYGQVLSAFSALLSDLADMLTDARGVKEYLKYFDTAVGAYSVGKSPAYLNRVITGDIGKIRAYGKKCVFVIGMADGVFPAPADESGLLSPYDKLNAKNAGAELSAITAERIYDEYFLAYKAFTLASTRLYVSYAGGTGDDGNARTPSCFYLQLKNYGGTETDFTAVDILDRLQHKTPALEKLSVHLGDNSSVSRALEEYFAKTDRRGLETIQSALDYGDFIKLSPEVLAKLHPKDLYMSPTQLKVISGCKFAHFVKYVLRVDSVGDSKYSALDRGNFVHDALNHAVTRFIEEYGNVTASAQDISNISSVLSREYLKNNLSHLEENHRFVYMFDRVRRTVEVLLTRLSKEFAQSKFLTSATELPISYDSTVKPMPVPIGDGRKLFIKGTIDRVDLFKSGEDVYARVVDYKTGSESFSYSEVENGRGLQLLMYLFSLCENGAELTGAPAKPAGALYLPAKNPVKDATRDFETGELTVTAKKDIQPSGVLLDNEDVLAAMDNRLEGEFIPVTRSKNGDLKGAVTEDKFDILKRRVTDILAQAGESIVSGDITVNPLEGMPGFYKSTCDLCDFSAICGRRLNKCKPREYRRIRQDRFYEEYGDK